MSISTYIKYKLNELLEFIHNHQLKRNWNNEIKIIKSYLNIRINKRLKTNFHYLIFFFFFLTLVYLKHSSRLLCTWDKCLVKFPTFTSTMALTNLFSLSKYGCHVLAMFCLTSAQKRWNLCEIMLALTVIVLLCLSISSL